MDLGENDRAGATFGTEQVHVWAIKECVSILPMGGHARQDI